MANTLLDALPAPATHKGVSYRPDIDGLRTLAVLAVVLYHANIGPFSGGFVGVDVFFVISGFLIMSTLASDIAAGRFSILAFYERRIRRIFPALFAMMAVVTGIAILVMSPQDLMLHGRSLVAAASSLSNVYFDFSGGSAGYFNNATEARLLLHTWSLSVEEQFYVLLPIALLLLRGRSRRTLVTVLALLAVASFALAMVLVAYRPMDAFYLVFPRAWELLAGCLLALWRVPAIGGRWLREAASAAGLVAIAAAVFGFTRSTPFPGAAALLPCLGAVLLIFAGATGPTWVGRVLSTSPSVYIGRISYSLYLWHWPVIVFVGQAAQVHSLDSGELTRNAKILILVASFAAAILSYHFVETPFRRRRPSRRPASRHRIVVGGAAAIAACVLFGVALVAVDGLPARFDNLVLANLAQEAAEAPSSCYHFRQKVGSDQEFGRCDEDRPKAHNIAVIGDSHAGSLLPLLRTMESEGKTNKLGIVSAIVAACPLSERMNALPSDSHCNTSTHFAYDRALAPDIDLVVVAFSPWWLDEKGLACLSKDDVCQRPTDPTEAENVFLDELDGRVRMLLDAGKKVVVQLPIPTYDKSIPRYMSTKIVYGRIGSLMASLGMVRDPRRRDYASFSQRLTTLAQHRGVVAFDARSALCGDKTCDYERDSVSLYMDNNHIAANRIKMLEEPLEAALQLVASTNMSAAR